MRKKAETKQDKQETMIYCGPDIKGVAKTFSAFREIPRELSEAAQKCPVIKSMIVPVEKLAEMRRQLRENGSTPHIFSKKIAEFFRKEVK